MTPEAVNSDQADDGKGPARLPTNVTDLGECYRSTQT